MKKLTEESLEQRAAEDLQKLPRGSELVYELELAILRLFNEGAQKDALRLHLLKNLDDLPPR